MTPVIEKTCKSCRRIKPVEDFYENKFSPDGRYAFCKICFDRFAKKLKEKERELSSAPSTKTCAKCGKVRPIDAFEDAPNTPDGKNGWCGVCRRQSSDTLKKQQTQKAPVPGRIPAPTPPPKTTPPPRPVNALDPSDDFDYIEHLIDGELLKKKTPLENLQIPKQITKITTRKRVCNGCGKTEEIDQIDKNTVIPVHAWFCSFCRQRSTKRLVRKGTTVCDYWGREFKVTKIISQDIVMGVMKNKTGNWEKKPVKIYGNWRIA